MHAAFHNCQVIDWRSLPFQVESIDTCGSRLYVGTSKGQLLVYDITGPADLKDCAIELKETKKTFAKTKAITQLHVVKELGLLLSLADNVIQVTNLTSLEHLTIVEKTRGCVSFAADLQILGHPSADSHRRSEARKGHRMNVVLRLAAVFRRRIVTFTWIGNEFVEQKDLGLPDSPRTVIWAGESLLLGFKREYSLVSEETLNTTKVFSTGERSEGIGIRMLGNEMLLNHDNVSHFIDMEGKPSRKYGISWSDVPLAVEVFEPFALAMLAKSVEIRSLDNGGLVQTVQLDRSLKCFAQDTMLFVASETFCWTLKPVPLEQQIDELMTKHFYAEALALSSRISDDDQSKPEKVLRIKKSLALSEFEKKNYTEAFKQFSELDINPMEVISILPFLVPDNSSAPARPLPDPTDQSAASSALVEYLTQRRNKILRQMDQPNALKYLEIIDTTLLRCYLLFNQAMIGPLLRLPQNFCNVEESEALLKKNDKLSDLVLLYRSRGMHRAALELLQLNATRAGPLFGTDQTVTYLQRLPPESLELILDFSKWVLAASPQDGFKIFVHENSPYAPQLPHDRVLAHLQTFAPSLVIPYLECAINQWHDETPAFHNLLAQAYLARVKAVDITEQSPERRQLLDFLMNSKFYKPESLMTSFSTIDGLYEERAVLFGRTQNHAKALELYAIRLRSPEKAEAYCAQVFGLEPKIYEILLRTYLPSNGQQNVPAALEVLRKYPDRIDTAKALEYLPVDTKLKDIREFLMSVIQERAVVRRDAQLMRSLAKVENLQVRTDLLQLHAIHVEITDEQLCLVCRKGIKTSAFAFYPNGVMVHLYCSFDPSICPCTNPKCTLAHNPNRVVQQ